MPVVRSRQALSKATFVLAVLSWAVAAGGSIYSYQMQAQPKSPLDIGVPVGMMLAVAIGALTGLTALLLAVVAFYKKERSGFLWAGTIIAASLVLSLVSLAVC